VRSPCIFFLAMTQAKRALALKSLEQRAQHGSQRNHLPASPVAALFVSAGGTYVGLPGVDAWDRSRDARLYAGPWPVVAHPPCERWGRYWGGSPRKPHQFKLGADDGCFASALASVRRWGGILEHPEGSHAWRHFGLNIPPRNGGWIMADFEGGWTCCVEQGHYGHLARKATWLYAHGVELPSLIWGKSPQRIHPIALAKHGYEKARRIGVMAMVGGKNKTLIREATPPAFRDLLISIARSRIAGFGPHAEISPVDANPGRAFSSLARRGISLVGDCSADTLRIDRHVSHAPNSDAGAA